MVSEELGNCSMSQNIAVILKLVGDFNDNYKITFIVAVLQQYMHQH